MWVIGWKGRKEKGYWRKEGRRRVMGVGRKEKGDWKKEGTNKKVDWRKEGRKKRKNEAKMKKREHFLVFLGFFLLRGSVI